MKIALIHDWLIEPGGGAENTLREIHALFPAPIYTLLWNRKPFETATIIPSFIQKIPGVQTYFRSLLPLFPLAIERFDLRSYDLIISSSHCVAKGVITQPHQLHICYCHTPMRYAWDLSEEYLEQANLHSGIKGWMTRHLLQYLKHWDARSSKRVDHFIANSHFVAGRIKKNYHREASVIYPPVDTTFYSLQEHKQNYYVTCSRLVAYKKVDLIVKAFSQMPDLKLIVIGEGPESNRIKQKAAKNIEFLGYVPNAILRTYLQQAKAFLFAAIEDFGITPIEAMACGTPVIALRQGGCAETIIDQKTGLFFEQQTAEQIQQAVRRFESIPFDPKTISQYAARFSKERFRQELTEFVKKLIL